MAIFSDCEGIFLVDFLPCGTTINDLYYPPLLYQLRSSIRGKRRRKLRLGVLLLHDNASIHKFNITQTAVQYTGSTKLNHLAYSPDLASSDYHMFSYLKNVLRGRNFETDDEAIMIVDHCLKSLDSNFFSRGIESSDD